MGIITLFFLSLGLSMDAFAVSITNGMCFKESDKKNAFYTALAFGVFQGLMPIIGYFAGSAFSSIIENYDHWIAFVFLGIIGGKMIYEAFQKDNYEMQKKFTFKLLIVQAIATSIDALAVGVSLIAFDVNIFTAAIFICAVTFICSFIGVLIGKKFGGMLKQKAEIFGGIILIIIGTKILIEHLFQ